LGEGCRFAKRCPYAEERCFSETPALTEARPHHFVACHRVRELNKLD
ncbi:MAG: peptide ABC transporter ATP-binding protein, partial [Pyramidobacter sp.]|nr:peptide ABC transporter ATP-binding protein [Pyramidobacter sp.]